MKPEIDLVSVLTELLQQQPDVLALFLVGSYADQSEDSWSDLDPFVIVADGAFSTYSASLDWLRPVRRPVRP